MGSGSRSGGQHPDTAGQPHTNQAATLRGVLHGVVGSGVTVTASMKPWSTIARQVDRDAVHRHVIKWVRLFGPTCAFLAPTVCGQEAPDAVGGEPANGRCVKLP
jgi:hypothetical protein